MNVDIKLSENFYLSEFLVSQTASRMGIDNTPSDDVISNLKVLCKNVLQPVRDNYNLPVIVSSGYRSKVLNSIIGGSRTSQHCVGEAADFEIFGIDNYLVAQWIRENLKFDQLILEYYSGGNTGWVHCSYSRRRLREQALTINSRGVSSGLIPA